MITLRGLLAIVEREIKKPTWISLAASVYLFCVISYLDKPLAVGLAFLVFLVAVTFLVMRKMGVHDQYVYDIFLIALIIHFFVVLSIYYFNLKPFGGGADFEGYNRIAIEIASRLSHGVISMAGLYTDHFFPILMGVIYLLLVPGMIVGQFFVTWLAAISTMLVYLLVREIGGTKKVAFFVGLAAVFYPSYLYFGSVLLKDTMVIPMIFLAMLLIVTLLKKFSWITFFLFFFILTALINLRFYVGYAIIFSLVLSWPLLSSLAIKKRIRYGAVIVLLLGFSPMLLGNGYYGLVSFKTLLNPTKITYYREILYSNSSPVSSSSVVAVNTPAPSTPTSPAGSTSTGTTTAPTSITPTPVAAEPAPVTPTPAPSVPIVGGSGSTFNVETGFNHGIFSFVKNSALSFFYSLLGPFPWQFTQKRQVVGLGETLPWYLLIALSVYSITRFIKKRGALEFLRANKFSLPLLIFAVLAMGALSLYINNYGIIARIRIPMIISFICIMLAHVSEEDYEKISYYWRLGVHRVSSFAKAFIFGQ